MVSSKENKARLQEFFRFDKAELVGIFAAVLVTALIFSFRDWGEESFSLAVGLGNLFLMIIIAAFSFFFRISCQKIFALSQGYKADFKIWWAGLIIALVVAFISVGHVPLVIIGGVTVSFMVKHRLGEFRYGESHGQSAVIALWGVMGNLIVAILFALGLYFSPESYFFSKGLWLNLIMAFCAMIPLPQLDGLRLFFGSRGYYLMGIAIAALAALLLLSGTRIGLILAIVLGVVIGAIYILIGSEK